MGRLVVLTTLALGIWTLLCVVMIVFGGSHGCRILRPIPPGEFPSPPPPLTQAEMDEMAAACDRPPTGTLVIGAVGYLGILGAAWFLRSEEPIEP